MEAEAVGIEAEAVDEITTSTSLLKSSRKIVQLKCNMMYGNQLLICHHKLIRRSHARDQTSSKRAFKKVANQFQFFCIESNMGDVVFSQIKWIN